MGQQILFIIHILLALAIVGLILLQHGKGAEVGAAFGSGASQTLFGSRGSASFLSRLTAILAVGFAITSLSMGYTNSHREQPKSMLEKIEEMQKSEEIPVIPSDTNADDKSDKSGSKAIKSVPVPAEQANEAVTTKPAK